MAEVITKRVSATATKSQTLTSGAIYTCPMSAYNGGAVCNNKGSVTGGGITFTGNTVTSSTNNGGAIYNSSGTVTLSDDTKFNSNYAGNNGGAICNDKKGSIVFSGASVSFSGNTAMLNGGAIYNTSSSMIDFNGATASFTNNFVYNKNATTTRGGAVCNTYGGVITFGDVSFTGNTAGKNGGAICNGGANGGVINLKNAIFSGNNVIEATGAGGAIYNSRGIINFSETIDLQTESDTWVNMGTNSGKTIVNWDLTGGSPDQCATIKGFQRFSNTATALTYITNNKQYLTVNANQEPGDYTIASGSFTYNTLSANNSTNFTIKTAEDETGAAITVNGDSVEYNGLTYTLAVQDNSALVLNVASPFQRIVVSDGETSSLAEGQTYTNPDAVLGNGAVAEVLSGGVLYTSGASFAGNTALEDENAMSGGYGGAIYNEGSLYVSGGSFTNNSATLCGGAIYNEGTLDVSGATFSGNATSNGGAIENYDGTVNVSGCSFTDNTAKYGGVIYICGGRMDIFDATFSGNSGIYGGAIDNYDGTVNVSGATFSGNSADSGGAICNDQGTVNLLGAVTLETKDDTIFNAYDAVINWDLSNAAPGANAVLNGYQYLTNEEGGILTITVNAEQTTGDYTIATGSFDSVEDKKNFTIKTADDAGTAITIGGDSVEYNGLTYTLAVQDNSALVLNVASPFQRIVVSGGETSSLVEGQTYTNPDAFTGNGAVAEVLQGGVLYTNGAGFADNTALRDATTYLGGLGGAICNSGTMYVSGGAFTNNTCVWGGAIFNKSGAILNASSASFSGNTAANGGAICNEGTMDACDVTFSGNIATTRGGAIHNSNAMVSVTSATFSGNTANTTGGAIYNNGGTANLSGVTFSGNTAKTLGGAIYNYNGTANISGGTFSGNTTGKNGGAIYNNGTMNVSGAIFSGNIATSGGGAIYNAKKGTVNLLGAVTLETADDTICNTSGGIINWDLSNAAPGSAVVLNGYQYLTNAEGGILTITVNAEQTLGDYTIATGSFDSIEDKKNFTIKTADDAGTAITIGGESVTYNGLTYTLAVQDNSALVLNVASPFQRIVVLDGETSSLAEGQTYTNPNPDVYYGAVAEVLTGGVLYTNGASFADNTALYDETTYSGGCGGAICNDGTTYVSGGSFTNNSCTLCGGAIYNDGTMYVSGGASFTGNTTYNGGAIYNYSGAVNVSGGSFADNVADYGGAIYNVQGTMDLSDVTFTGNNTANNGGGGAIYNDSDTILNVSGATFSGNSANYAGAIYNESGAIMNVSGATFSGNTAYNGGAIYNFGTANVSGATFSGNTAGSGGAILNNDPGVLNVSGATFSGNSAIKGGAIWNGGTVNLLGDVTLETANDTIYNKSGATINWDLSNAAPGTAVILNGYQYLTNANGVSLTITVNAEQTPGDYTIAAGSFDSIEDKKTFTIKTAEDATGAAITIGGDSVKYNGLTYTLAVQDNSALVLTAAKPAVTYIDEDGDKQTISSYATVGDSTSGAIWTAGTYVVGADYNEDGVINAEDAKVAGKQTSFTISGGATVSGAVKLIVADGFSLTVDSTGVAGAAGIAVTGDDNGLVIYGQEKSSGKLTAKGGANGAGIGGGNGKNGQNVTIAGGTVIATGGANASGIGGGNGGTASNITVTGIMDAKANSALIAHEDSTDISAEFNGKISAAAYSVRVNYLDETFDTHTVAIGYTLVKDSDSAVTWTEGTYVVGADYNGDGVINAADADVEGKQTSFTISGGVTVSGAVKLIVADGFSLTVDSSGTSLAGITVTGADNSFTVYGQCNCTGTLTAKGGVNGAGIGGSNGQDGQNIAIVSGKVIAEGGENGAGIGGGANAGCQNITIAGGSIDVTGGANAAGIGTGANGTGSGIAIRGGKGTATGGTNGSGIGGNAGNISGIYAKENVIVKAGESAGTATEIAHTATQDISTDLSGKQYASLSLPGASAFAVNYEWAGKESGEVVELNGVSYVMGQSAFVSLNALIYSGQLTEASDIVLAGGNDKYQAYNKDGLVTFTQAVDLTNVNGTPNLQAVNNCLEFHSGDSTISGNMLIYRMDVKGDSAETPSSLTVKAGSTINMVSAYEPVTPGYSANIWVKKNGTFTLENGAVINIAGRVSDAGNAVISGKLNITDYSQGDGALCLTANMIWATATGGTLTVDGGEYNYTSDMATYVDNCTVQMGSEYGVVTNTANVINGGAMKFSGNALMKIYEGSTLNLSNGFLTVDGIGGSLAAAGTLTNKGGIINMDYQSKITTANAFTSTGSINVDMTGATETYYVLVDGGADSSFGTYQFDFRKRNHYYLAVDADDNDLYATTQLYFVSRDWAGLESGSDVSVTYDGVTYSGKLGDGQFSNDESSNPPNKYTVKVIVGARGFDGSATLNANYADQICGGYRQAEGPEKTGNISFTINGGVYNKTVNGGDTLTAYGSGNQIVRTGDINFTINNGEFLQRVVGGMFYNPPLPKETDTGSVLLRGNVNLTINGGIFCDRVYAGNSAKDEALGSDCTVIDGNVYLTIDTTNNKIAFDEHIIAGSRGSGSITGTTTVTFKGQGEKLFFADDSIVWGGCSGDKVKWTATTKRSQDSSVEGDTRTLAFDGFTGNFNAQAYLFSDIQFSNNADVNFSDTELDLQDINVWNFEAGSTADLNSAGNDFTDDELHITGNGSEKLTLLTADDASVFANFDNFAKDKEGVAKITWDGSGDVKYIGGVWTDGISQLALEENEEGKWAMTLSTIA